MREQDVRDHELPSDREITRNHALFVGVDAREEPPRRAAPHWAAIAAAGGALLVFGLVLVFALRPGGEAAAVGPPTATPIVYCTTNEGGKVYDLVKVYAQEWDDADELASSTSRMSLAPQVAQLQRIRRDVQAQKYPACGQKAQRLLVEMMDANIDGYIAFLSQDPDSVVKSHMRRAYSLEADFLVALAELEGPLSSPAASPSATATVKR